MSQDIDKCPVAPLLKAQATSTPGGSVRSYQLKCSVEWSKMDGYKDVTQTTSAYSAEDAVFQTKYFLRHWQHTIHSVAPNDPPNEKVSDPAGRKDKNDRTRTDSENQ